MWQRQRVLLKKNPFIFRSQTTNSSTSSPKSLNHFKEVKTCLYLTAGATLTLTATILSVGWCSENVRVWYPPYIPTGKFIELFKNKVKMHVLEKGQGDVTVVLDSSVGEAGYTWSKVADDLSKSTKVIAIDRLGLGFSDKSLNKRSAQQLVVEYQAALQALDISGDIILVGTGTGGYTMRLLAQTLEENDSGLQVVGLILADAAVEGIHSKLLNVSPAVSKLLSKMKDNVKQLYQMSYFGVPRLIDYMQQKGTVKKYTSEAFPDVQHYMSSIHHRAGMYQEHLALEETEQYFTTHAVDLHTPTIVVVSHGKPTMFNGLLIDPNITLEMTTKLERIWMSGQVALADSFHDCKKVVHVVHPSAGHLLPQHHPETITESVRAILAEHSGDSEGGVDTLQALALKKTKSLE